VTIQDVKAHEALDRLLEDMRKERRSGRIEIVVVEGNPVEARPIKTGKGIALAS